MDTAGAEVEVNWINGDYNRLSPLAAWKPLAPGQSKVVFLKMRNLRNLINIPRGFYLVSSTYPEGVPLTFNLKPNADLDAYEARVAQDMYQRNTRRINIEEAHRPPVFPTPVSYTWRDDRFDLNQDLVIIAAPAFGSEAAYLQNELAVVLGEKPALSDSPKEGQSVIRLTRQEGFGPEAYRLVVSKGAIQLEASAPAGIFYAIQSLKSLLPATVWAGGFQSGLQLRGVEIEDAPVLATVHLCWMYPAIFKPKNKYSNCWICWQPIRSMFSIFT